MDYYSISKNKYEYGDEDYGGHSGDLDIMQTSAGEWAKRTDVETELAAKDKEIAELKDECATCYHQAAKVEREPVETDAITKVLDKVNEYPDIDWIPEKEVNEARVQLAALKRRAG